MQTSSPWELGRRSPSLGHGVQFRGSRGIRSLLASSKERSGEVVGEALGVGVGVGVAVGLGVGVAVGLGVGVTVGSELGTGFGATTGFGLGLTTSQTMLSRSVSSFLLSL